MTEFLDGPARGYSWPGNVRELQTAVRSLALGVPPRLGAEAAAPTVPALPGGLLDGTWTMDAAKLWYARHVLARSRSARAAATRLGVHRGTLARWLEEAADGADA